MKSFLFPLTILVLLIYSCVGNKKNVQFASQECFRLSEKERNIYPIDQKGLDEFEKCCYVDSSNVALNRVILGDSLNYYIGLHFQMIPQDFELLMKQDSKFKIYNSQTFSTKDKYFYAYFIKNQKASVFLNRNVYTEPKTDLLIVFDIISPDSLKVLRAFENKQFFLDKINCKK
ncbi:MAG: hypothetical protein D6707_00135 [Bacteroidetes bacterium]|nr:MAG: hypothetical protein D6707_00135 [Bacteroidota bacterium]